MSDEIVINRSEWSTLQSELDKMRALLGLGIDVDVVGSDQFKQLQTQLGELRMKSEKQTVREEKLKSELQIMEEQWNQRAEEHQTQTSELNSHVKQSKDLLEYLQKTYKVAFDESRVRLHGLSSDRDRIVGKTFELHVLRIRKLVSDEPIEILHICQQMYQCSLTI